MKTAKEWFIEAPRQGALANEHTEWLKAIQLDAWKQGMTDAAEICSENAMRCALLHDVQNTCNLLSKTIIDCKDAKKSL